MKASNMRRIATDRLIGDRRGNVTITFAFAIIPLLLAAGTAIDYTRAALIRGRLAAIADAASLAATTPAMLQQSTTTAKAAAVAMFTAQASQMNGLTFDPTKLNVSVVDSTGVNGYSRTVSVAYTGTVNNFFGNIEGVSHSYPAVASTANLASAPNINFYLMLDSSPSMELPATTAGINTMVAKTGCALACHETDYTDSELSVHYPGWGSIDSYTFAQNSGITLRIDNVRIAATNLVTQSNSMMKQNKATYQMAAYTFSDGVTNLLALAPTSDANVSPMQTAISKIAPPLMADNSYLPVGGSYTYPKGTAPSTYTTVASIPQSATTNYKSVTSGKTTTKYYGLLNNDAGTNFAFALNTLNNAMPTPGKGTTASGDSPQGVLMIVTDGVDDVTLYKSSSCSTSHYWSYSNSYGSFYRCQQPVNTALCATIKARGIRIAVLYTTYFPVTSNAWYNNTVAPFISQVPGNLQNCASSQDLYYEVNTDGDIVAALQQLFINAVTTAPHLIQ